MRKKRFETPEVKRSKNDKKEEDIQLNNQSIEKIESTVESLKDLQIQIAKQLEEGANEMTFLEDGSKMYLSSIAKKHTKDGDFKTRSVIGS